MRPCVPCKTTASRNTRASKWPEFKGAITIWHEFNLDNLNESDGHILDCPVPGTLVVPDPEQFFAAAEITTTLDTRTLTRRSYEIMVPTLDFARRQFNLHPGLRLNHTYSARDSSVLARVRGAAKATQVDHVIELDGYPTAHLVIGFGRPRSKFQGRIVANPGASTPKDSFNNVLPLRQLGDACRTAKTRYGYLQTDEDLVVCCFSKQTPTDGPGAEAKTPWKVAVMPIPWSTHTEMRLTTDLALWWVSMLAMSAPEHRAIVREGDMVRINEWDTFDTGDEQGWVRRHRYSNWEDPTTPPPQVGIHADPLFDINEDSVLNLSAAADALGNFDFSGLHDEHGNLVDLNLWLNDDST